MTAVLRLDALDTLLDALRDQGHRRHAVRARRGRVDVLAPGSAHPQGDVALPRGSSRSSRCRAAPAPRGRSPAERPGA